MAAHGQMPDFCLVGEPTNPARLGEVVKIGRRGSLTARITVRGIQGHSAYPHRADNPIHRLVRVLADLTASPLDSGTVWFEPSTVQVTGFDVGNPAANVIPAAARAVVNIRFNDLHTGESLRSWLEQALARHAERFDLAVSVSGESFRTEPGAAVRGLCAAIQAATGITPRLDTGGGTSDARFIKNICPVVELGLAGATMHKANECVPVAEIAALTDIYAAVLRAYFV
jgi:succinyl-diaminopimelate desuccinylase